MEIENFDELVRAWEEIYRKEDAGEPLTASEKAMLFHRPPIVAVAELVASPRFGRCFYA
jgi:hypothetical protein